jgi:hypothetical protein
MSFQANTELYRSAVAEEGSPIFAEDAGLTLICGSRVTTGSRFASELSAMNPMYRGSELDHAVEAVVPNMFPVISETVSVSLAVIVCSTILPCVALEGITTNPGLVELSAVPSEPAKVSVPAL